MKLSEQCISTKVIYLGIVFWLDMRDVRHFGGWLSLRNVECFSLLTMYLSINIYALYLKFVFLRHRRIPFPLSDAPYVCCSSMCVVVAVS